MALQPVLDDGEPKARAAFHARPRAIDTVEALGEPRQVLGQVVAEHPLPAGVRRITTTRRAPAPSRSQRSVITPSAGVYLTAFEIRFEAME